MKHTAYQLKQWGSTEDKLRDHSDHSLMNRTQHQLVEHTTTNTTKGRTDMYHKQFSKPEREKR